jgi:hypothetical protein
MSVIVASPDTTNMSIGFSTGPCANRATTQTPLVLRSESAVHFGHDSWIDPTERKRLEEERWLLGLVRAPVSPRLVGTAACSVDADLAA